MDLNMNLADLTPLDVATTALAMLGAVLGVINTWHSLDQTRVKLRVVPKRVIHGGALPWTVTCCIEVTNMGAVAVTVDQVGLFYWWSSKRGVIGQPIIPDGGAWPRRLEPRSSVSLYFDAAETHKGPRVRCAFASTQCGHVATGTSPALRQIAREPT